MKKIFIVTTLTLMLVIISIPALSETLNVLIKGVDDGVKTNKQQDYNEAVMNAKLQAIERAGVEIQSITRVVNFQTKFDMVESKAKAILLPGFQIMDMGYQKDGSYQIVLSCKVKVGSTSKRRTEAFQKYLAEANKRLDSGDYSQALANAENAMKIPGYESNKDAEYLKKLAYEKLQKEKKDRKRLAEAERQKKIVCVNKIIYLREGSQEIRNPNFPANYIRIITSDLRDYQFPIEVYKKSEARSKWLNKFKGFPVAKGSFNVDGYSRTFRFEVVPRPKDFNLKVGPYSVSGAHEVSMNIRTPNVIVHYEKFTVHPVHMKVILTKFTVVRK